jgi:phosphoribosylaminoimidazolecarboxamide formyltransferase/IMP cyclohydrolase
MEENITLNLKSLFNLKYGENPHQKNAQLLVEHDSDPLAYHRFNVVYGVDPSFVTALDLNRGKEAIISVLALFDVNHRDAPYVVYANKHGNACGAAFGENGVSTIHNALKGNLEDVLGAMITLNFEIGLIEAEAIFSSLGKKWRKLAGIACRAITEEAIAFISKKEEEKDSKTPIFINPSFGRNSLGVHNLNTKPILYDLGRGTFLCQDTMQFIPTFTDDERFMIYGKIEPLSDETLEDVLLAEAVCRHSNSNTITIVRNGRLLGNGVGQQSRVGGAKLAVQRALEGLRLCGEKEDLTGAVARSDSFFPFPDGIKVLSDAGIKTIIGTTGSKNDDKIIAFCQEEGITYGTYSDKVGRVFSNHC